MVRKVAVINFKGGVGKTTLTFHLAAYLARAKKRVLVIDLDHQSSLSMVILSMRLWEPLSKDRLTSNRIFEAFCNRRVSNPNREIICENPLHKRHPQYNFYPTLDLVPAQFELDDTEIEMASTTVGSPTISEWQKRTLLAEWLDRIEVKKHYDYVLFDCPPATKLVSQNALAASDSFVIPVIPDTMSSRGVTHFRNLVTEKLDKKMEFLRRGAAVGDSDVPESYVPTTKLAAIVPFMVKSAGRAESGITNLHTEQLAALRRQWGGAMIQETIRHMTGVPEALERGWPVWTAFETPNIGRAIPMLEECCKEVVERLET